MSSFMSIGTMVIELREFIDKKKNMGKMGLVIILAKRYFACSLVLTCVVLKVRTEFPNMWGEYTNTMAIPIQGTTVPHDYQ